MRVVVPAGIRRNTERSGPLQCRHSVRNRTLSLMDFIATILHSFYYNIMLSRVTRSSMKYSFVHFLLTNIRMHTLFVPVPAHSKFHNSITLTLLCQNTFTLDVGLFLINKHFGVTTRWTLIAKTKAKVD